MDNTRESTLPASDNGTRWMGVGHSNAQDSSTAGAEAAKQALRGEDPKLLVVFCSDSYDLPTLLDAINKESGGVPLIGCSTAGEIATDGRSCAAPTASWVQRFRSSGDAPETT